jgi:membrane-bound lytic murein transglycosylase D
VWFERAGFYLPYFKAIFKKFGIPEDLAYLALMESGCSPFAVSRAGAVGFWQFIKSTARRYGLKINYWVDERKDFIKATYAAARYLKDLYELFGDWRAAVASYNAGEGRLLRLMKIRNFASFWQIMTSGLLPYETAAYLPQWMAIVLIAKNPEKYGFKPIRKAPLLFEEVKVEGGLDLRVIAMAGGIDLGLLYLLNAKFRRGITPPGKVSKVRVPLYKAEEVKRNLPLVPVVKVRRRFYRRGYFSITTLPYLVNESPVILYKLAKRIKMEHIYD